MPPAHDHPMSFKLSETATLTRSKPVAVNGRKYFEDAARELGIEGLDPVALQEGEEDLQLEDGAGESRLGGHITRDLKCPSPEEAAERRLKSEKFLKQPAKHFAAEEQSSDQGNDLD